MTNNQILLGGLVAASLTLQGCASFDPTDLAEDLGDLPTNITFTCEILPGSDDQGGSGGGESSAFLLSSSEWVTPTGFADDQAVSSLETIFRSSAIRSQSVSGGESTGVGGLRVYNPRQATKTEELTLGDMRAFRDHLKQGMKGLILSNLSSPGGGESAEGDAEKSEILKDYFFQFVLKGFQARDGVHLDRLEIAKSYGHERFGAIVHLLVESAHDGLAKTPALYRMKKGKKEFAMYTDNVKDKSKPPSGVSLGYIKAEKILGDGKVGDTNVYESEHCGITEAEYRVIAGLTASSETAAALVSSAAIEALNGVSLAVIVGADFAIGDAETLPTMIKTFVAKSNQLLQYAAMYEFFYHFSYRPLSASAPSGGESAGSAAPSDGGISIVGMAGPVIGASGGESSAVSATRVPNQKLQQLIGEVSYQTQRAN